MKRDIKIQWQFSSTPEKVWEMLTNPEKLKLWLNLTSEFKPIIDTEYEQHQKPRGDWDGIIYHKIIQVKPLQRLSYTFQSGPKKGVITLDTVVTFTLIPNSEGTVLMLEHSGFTGIRNCITSYILEMGWKNQIAKRFRNILSEN